MKDFLLVVAFVTATVYHPVPEQTNSEYWITASGQKIDTLNPIKHKWVAVSRDLEEKGFTLGRTFYVSGAGEMDGTWTVQDRMNKRWTNRIDFLVNKTTKGGKWENVKIYFIE